MKTVVAARITTEECQKLDRIARCAGLNRSDALRALLRAVDRIDPPKLARAHFENNDAAELVQARGGIVAA